MENESYDVAYWQEMAASDLLLIPPAIQLAVKGKERRGGYYLGFCSFSNDCFIYLSIK